MQGSIYLASLYLSEKSVGRNLRELVKGTPPWPNIDPEKAIPWVEKKLNLTLAASQREAVAAAL